MNGEEGLEPLGMRQGRVFIYPTFGAEDKGDGGIRRVIEAQKRYLPTFGWEVVETAEEADVIATHATEWVKRVRANQVVVSHCHGLYWSEYKWNKWEYDANSMVMNALRQADAVTAPSEWVARILRKEMLLDPVMLHHGVSEDEWPEPTDAEWLERLDTPFVLWNKTRVDPVCDPRPLIELAKRAPDITFVTTVVDVRSMDNLPPNIKLTGKLNYDVAKALVRRAAVYLATTRETFGIGTLEAMAAGVPVLGWDWAGQHEIIEHKRTGWLSRPGDYDNLLEGLRYGLAEHKSMGLAAREAVLSRWTWPQIIAGYSDLYAGLVESSGLLSHNQLGQPKVSVVVTCYELERYLTEAIESIMQQTLWAKGDVEIVVVDDASPGDKSGQSASLIIESFAGRHAGAIKFVRNDENLYLAGALNKGIATARGKYIMCLDADNMMGSPRALEILVEALDGNDDLDIVYGAVGFIDWDEDKGETKRYGSPWPWEHFSTFDQLRGRNQVPSTCLYRKRIWDRIGGYRSRLKTSEDADFWTRAVLAGAKPKRVGDFHMFTYRNRTGSMSNALAQHSLAYHAWYPYAGEGASADRGGVGSGGKPWQCDPTLVPAACYESDERRRAERVHNVHTGEPSSVAVVIPVGPGHAKYVIDALDSVYTQSFKHWDVVVVDDTRGELEMLDYALPAFAAVVENSGNDHKHGPAGSRNVGVEHVMKAWPTVKAVVFLDADDFLEHDALELMWAAYTEGAGKPGDVSAGGKPGGYVYGDWIAVAGDDGEKGWRTGERKNTPSWELIAQAPFKQMYHSVTTLVPVAAWKAIGGFDENIDYWEDWDFFLRLREIGCCGIHVPHVTFYYRVTTGTVRDSLYVQRGELIEGVRERWREYLDGSKQLMGCGCGGGSRQPQQSSITQRLGISAAAVQRVGAGVAAKVGGPGAAVAEPEPTLVKLKYIRTDTGVLPFRGQVTNVMYRFGPGIGMNEKLVDSRDATHLLRLVDTFVVVGEPVATSGATPTGVSSAS